jgi:glycosyltransferase involved in cell wall biosynthesis
MRPHVSVIVPAFNAAASIEETLDSVLGQTYENFDVVVVDDGSQDDTAVKVGRLAARDPRITLVRQNQSGIAAARNLAIERSSGELVAPLDADDLWHPRKLELQVRTLEAAPPSVAFLSAAWRLAGALGLPALPARAFLRLCRVVRRGVARAMHPLY